jgi:glycine cleavage system H protein
VKAVSDLYSPVSGVILEVNENVDADDFSAMKSDAFGKGWVLKVKPSDVKELDSLLDAKAYDAQLEH